MFADIVSFIVADPSGTDPWSGRRNERNERTAGSEGGEREVRVNVEINCNCWNLAYWIPVRDYYEKNRAR